MKKTILLSFLTLLSFSFEILAMEENQDDVAEKKEFTKRKLDSQSPQNPDSEGPTPSSLLAKKPKLRRENKSTLMNEPINYPAYTAYGYFCKNDSQGIGEEKKTVPPLEKMPSAPVFKEPFHPAIALYIKTGDWEKYACQSASNMRTSDPQKNITNAHSLSSTRGTTFYIPRSNARAKSIEKKDRVIKIFDLCDTRDNGDSDPSEQNQNHRLSPTKALYTKGYTFCLPKGSTLKDL